MKMLAALPLHPVKVQGTVYTQRRQALCGQPPVPRPKAQEPSSPVP